MIGKSEWQEATRELAAEDRRKLGEPPTAEEMLAYSRGELAEVEQERIRDLLVAYPELARMYGAPVPDASGEEAWDEEVEAGWQALQRRIGQTPDAQPQRETVVPFRRRYLAPLAALLAGLTIGVLATSALHRSWQRGSLPVVLGAPQELTPDGNRGAGAPTLLRKDGGAYFVQPRLINAVRHPHYRIELRDAGGTVVWSNNTAAPDENDAFSLVLPHTIVRDGETYRLHIFGVDGEASTLLGSYDLRAGVE